MDYLRNHCWCSSSHWDNKMFDCQIIISLSSYREGYTEDWENLTHKVKVFSQKKQDEYMTMMEDVQTKYLGKPLHLNPDFGHTTVHKLKPEVLQWLGDNIEDFQGEKGWCVGSDDYIARDSSCGLSIFMQRRKDAMLFIKTWSKYKKPINYTQYFTNVRKRLNLKTLKYVERV